MSYEVTSGLGVNSQYGPMEIGGTEGVLKTRGYRNEFTVNFDADTIPVKFPVGNGVWVTGVDATFSTGAITVATIGGVDVSAATDAAPVELDEANTGVVVITGPTAGTVVIEYKNVQS
jgi:hypothetical protein